MDQKFFNLDEEKQQRIISAAMKEFSAKGFDDASTLKIAKGAGISKGLLFHYFNTKRELFFFLWDYATDIIKRDYYGQVDIEEGDFFARMRQVLHLKLKVYSRYPFLFDFAKVAAYTDSEQIGREMEQKKARIMSIGYERLFANLDMSKFRDDIDKSRIQDLITWAIEGFGYRALDKTKNQDLKDIDVDHIYKEFDAYMEVLKKGFYKSERR